MEKINEYIIDMRMFFNDNSTYKKNDIVLHESNNEIKSNQEELRNDLYEKTLKYIFIYDGEEKNANNRWYKDDENDYIVPQRKLLKKQIIDLINCSEIEWGEYSEFERYFCQNIDINLLTLINQIFVENINNEDIIVKIFHAISLLSYEQTFPNAQTMCLAALSVDNIAIQESAIQLFEEWRNEEALSLLKKIRIKEEWLKEYADKIIDELEKELRNE